MHPDITSFISSLNKAGIVASRNPTTSTKKAVYCNCRTNPDGSIRWIWPVGSKNADFLKFYHRSGLKPQVFATAAKLLSRIGLSDILSDDSFFFYINDENYSLIKRAWGSRWAWFSGTIGPNRKSILWHNDKNTGSGTFIKIPLGPQAKENLGTEAGQLQRFQQMQFKNVVLPSGQVTDNGCLQLTEIGKHSKRTNRFSAIPFTAAIEWMRAGIKEHPYETSTFARDLGNMLEQLKGLDDARVSKGTLCKLRTLENKSSAPATLITTLAHGDFTPWNIMVKNNQLYCIDLELSRNHMPVLFDLFHFVYQSNIMIGNRGYKSIRRELDQLFALPEWQTFINEHGIDTGIAEKQYLLYTMAYYLEVYHRQPRWHIQVNWLLKTWDEALSWHLASGIVPARKLLLRDMEALLKDKQYAVLKWMHRCLETLPSGSDIDICINHADSKKLLQQLDNHVLVAGTRIQKRSFMMQLEIILHDGGVLHLDLISKLKRKSLVFMNVAEVLTNARENKYGLKTASIEDDFAYTWMFNWLNNNHIPERYQSFFGELGIKNGANLNIMLWRKYGLPIGSYEDVFFQNKPLKEHLLKILASNSENKGLRRLWNQFEYLIDTVRNLFPGRGFIITFSGVDGAGKSTVIANIRELVDKQLRKKVIVLRHRPGLLPILSAWRHGKQKAEGIAAQSLPRLGNNKSTWSSLFRFSYYFIDYLVGQWYVQLRYVLRGYVVLYDRYYFDFINDAKRSNIGLSPSFVAWLYRFLLKPRLNFFLYAHENIILQRKQELDALTIRGLTEKYLSLFEKLTNNSQKALYIPVENEQLPDTLNLIFTHIKELDHEKIN